MEGYTLKRIGRGSDYRAEKKDWLTGKTTERFDVEVKRNDSKLSRLQKQNKNNRVYRVRDDMLGSPSNVTEEDRQGNRIEREVFTGQRRKVSSKTKDPLDEWFGAYGSKSSSRRKQNSNGDAFGFFRGSSNTRKKGKRKSDDPFSIWG